MLKMSHRSQQYGDGFGLILISCVVCVFGQVIVDFSATWCGPCKVISPLFEELSTKFIGAIFLKVDVDAVEVSFLYKH